MAKKTKTKTKTKTKKRSDIGEAAHQIWLAGLGAVATAEEEGGKLFRTLVGRGMKYEDRVTEPVDRAQGRVREVMDDVRTRAGKTASNLEHAFDDRVRDAMHRLGIPTSDELDDLARRIEELNARIARRTGATGGTAAKDRSAAPSKRAATKRTAKKKTAAPKRTTKAKAKANKTAARKQRTR